MLAELTRHSADSRLGWYDFSVIAASPQRDSIAAGPLAAKMASSVGSRRRNSLLASIKTHLCRRGLSHLTSSAGHAGAGGVRNRAISDRISANICRDTATSASWKVT